MTALTLPQRLRKAASADSGWAFLTARPEKAAFYSLDTYFRQAWSDVDRLWGPDAPVRLQTLACILFRPDAVVGRRVGACLKFLRDNQFYPVRMKPLRLTRHMALDLWRYQHNAGTLDRIAATEELVTAADSLYVLLWDGMPHRESPATVRLRALKGSGAGDPPGTGPTLRSTAGIVNRVMAMLHTADEPMDLVRELGIYFPCAERRRVLSGLTLLTEAEVVTHLSALERRNPFVALDPEAALRRLTSRIGEVRVRPLDWIGLSATLADRGIVLPTWDRVLIASHYIAYDESDDVLLS